ncbi:hypothetical protein TNCV_2892701 [Trichonephila clavipes]|nr:hypothetical protein TNCV_2892701 [Trichonephila clavipes]
MVPRSGSLPASSPQLRLATRCEDEPSTPGGRTLHCSHCDFRVVIRNDILVKVYEGITEFVKKTQGSIVNNRPIRKMPSASSGNSHLTFDFLGVIISGIHPSPYWRPPHRLAARPRIS